MSRASKWSLGVLLVAFIIGVGYYVSYEPGGVGLRAECSETFNRLDSANNNDALDPGEFLAYGRGVSMGDFAKADSDSNQALTIEEFCSWSGPQAPTG